jgi:hypothetical protein
MVVNLKSSGDFSLRVNVLMRKPNEQLLIDNLVLNKVVAKVAVVFVKPFNYDV